MKTRICTLFFLYYYQHFNTESNNIPVGWPSTLNPSGHFNYSYAHIYWVNTENLLLRSPPWWFSFYFHSYSKITVTQPSDTPCKLIWCSIYCGARFFSPCVPQQHCVKFKYFCSPWNFLKVRGLNERAQRELSNKLKKVT